MLGKIKSAILGSAMLLSSIGAAHAGLIVYTDRAEFEAATSGTLYTEGFNSADILNSDLTVSNGTYNTNQFYVSEGEAALTIDEATELTVTFSQDVFALGFDINNLSFANLDYQDNAGNYLSAAITPNWESTSFFGVVSDVAVNSFTLMGDLPYEMLSAYGFDNLVYSTTASSQETDSSGTVITAEVPAPATIFLLLAGFAVLLNRRSVN